MFEKYKNLIMLLVTLLVIVLLVFLNLNIFKHVREINNEEKEKETNTEIEEKTLQILDEDSNTRPIAVMIDNIEAAFPQAGIQDAYLVYEIIVEGGYTRLLAVFKDKDTSLIGAVRSARHYFIDYAMENDALYAHYGWSPQAERDISTYDIDNLNGINNAGSAYWRITDKIAPHNAFTSITNLMNRATSLKYRTTSDQDTLLNYSIEEINLDTNEDSIVANEVSIPYSSLHVTKYVYDSDLKVYKRYINSKSIVDKTTKDQITTKNIIVINVRNYADPENSDKGRQALENVGTGTGYFITNGYAVPITYEKTSRSSQTVYKTIDGNEIIVNDGNTFIQIQPSIKTTTFK